MGVMRSGAGKIMGEISRKKEEELVLGNERRRLAGLESYQ